MSAIFFKPWVGEDYAGGKWFGKRVMILGESHYQGDEGTPREPAFAKVSWGDPPRMRAMAEEPFGDLGIDKAAHQRLELEVDLIASHLLVTGRVPRAQFLG